MQTRLTATTLSANDALHCRIDCAVVRCGGLPPCPDAAPCAGIDGPYSMASIKNGNNGGRGVEKTRAQYGEKKAARHGDKDLHADGVDFRGTARFAVPIGDTLSKTVLRRKGVIKKRCRRLLCKTKNDEGCLTAGHVC